MSRFWPNPRSITASIPQRFVRAVTEKRDMLQSPQNSSRQTSLERVLMRAVGWVAILIGVLTIIVLASVTYGGVRFHVEEPVISVVVAVLLILGGSSMARYRPPAD